MHADVSAVVFDLDLTLCTSSQDESVLLARAFDRVGVEQYCTVDDLADAVQEIDDADSDVDFYRRCLRHAARQTGVDAPHTELARAYDALVDHSEVEPLPGAIEAVEYARERYRTALLTNGGEETQRTKLRALGLEDAFDAVVFGDPDRGLKPDPAPFEMALSALDVRPECAVNIGDRPEADVRGAHEVGMHSVWVPPTEDPAGPTYEPTHRLETLESLPELL